MNENITGIGLKCCKSINIQIKEILLTHEEKAKILLRKLFLIVHKRFARYLYVISPKKSLYQATQMSQLRK